MSLGVTNWVDHGILNNISSHLNPSHIQLFWSSHISLLPLCTLRYDYSLICKCPGKNSVDVRSEMDIRLAYDVNTVLMSFFLNPFRNVGPWIDIHGRFMMFSILYVSKNCNGCSLMLNLAWLSSTNRFWCYVEGESLCYRYVCAQFFEDNIQIK